MTGWFGDTWHAPVCDPETWEETPVGAICPECQKPIGINDQGFCVPDYRGHSHAYHRICFLRTILPCDMWTPDMLKDMPNDWAEHRKTHHGN